MEAGKLSVIFVTILVCSQPAQCFWVNLYVKMLLKVLEDVNGISLAVHMVEMHLDWCMPCHNWYANLIIVERKRQFCV